MFPVQAVANSTCYPTDLLEGHTRTSNGARHDRDDGVALRYRREFAEHCGADHIDGAAKAAAEDEQRELQSRAVDARNQHQEAAADDERRRDEHAARRTRGETSDSAARCDVVLSRTGCHVFPKRNPAPEISMVCFQRGARRKAEGVTKIGKSVTFLSRLLSRRADGGRLAQVFSTRRRRLNRARGRDCHENCPKRHVRVPDSVTVPTERRTGRPKRLLTGLGPCGLARLGHGLARPVLFSGTAPRALGQVPLDEMTPLVA